MANIVTLNKLPIGKRARVVEIRSKGIIRRRLLDLGLIKDTIIKPLHISPTGDPIAYEIRDTVIAIRSEESKDIYVENQEEVIKWD